MVRLGMVRASALLLLVAWGLIGSASANDAKPKDCEVCISVLNKVEASFKEKSKQAKADKVKLDARDTLEKLIDEVCGSTKAQTEKKVCYYLKDIKREISDKMKNFMPPDRVCKKLKQNNPTICQVREAVKIEKGVTDYTKLKIRDLKKILMDRGVTCTNCLEKAEFVKRCQETEDLHDEL